jgi:hypothetical protein
MREVSGFVAGSSLLPALERGSKSSLMRNGLMEVAGYKPSTPIAVCCAFLAINERYLHSRLPDFDEVPIRVADVGANLEAMVLRVGKKLRTSG